MMKKIKNIFGFLMPVIVIMILVMPVFVLAANGETPPPAGGETPPAEDVSIKFKIPNPFKHDSIKALITAIINDILIPIGGVIATVMIIYAGFKYVTAGGNENKIKEAHDALKWAVIGAAILLGAWVISEAISATIDQLKSS